MAKILPESIFSELFPDSGIRNVLGGLDVPSEGSVRIGREQRVAIARTLASKPPSFWQMTVR